MRVAGIALAGLLAAGCALAPGRGLAPGKSTEAEVVARLGQPALALATPGGGRTLYFTRQPWDLDTVVASIGPDGALREIGRRFNWEIMHSVRSGMTKHEVRRLLGPPLTIDRLPRQQREVWEYPWRHAVREGRVLFVPFSDDGVVREAIERHDHERDPENDPWG
jgi:hypothetical protein